VCPGTRRAPPLERLQLRLGSNLHSSFVAPAVTSAVHPLPAESGSRGRVAPCLLDPRGRCRQQAVQGFEAEVVDDLVVGLAGWLVDRTTTDSYGPDCGILDAEYAPAGPGCLPSLSKVSRLIAAQCVRTGAATAEA